MSLTVQGEFDEALRKCSYSTLFWLIFHLSLSHSVSSRISSSELSKTRTSSSDAAANFQPIAIKPQRVLSTSEAEDAILSSSATTSKQLKNELNQLGRLDGLISNPSSRLNKVRVPDSKKIAAILLETNIVELQRHLLTITIQNQVSRLKSLSQWSSYSSREQQLRRFVVQ